MMRFSLMMLLIFVCFGHLSQAEDCNPARLVAAPVQQAKAAIDETLFTIEEAPDTRSPVFASKTLEEADELYFNENYADAIVRYKSFIGQYGHPVLSDYARFQIGMSHFLQYRGIGRDLEQLEKAIQFFEEVSKNENAGPFAEEAKEKLEAANAMLAQHELEIGLFYLRKETSTALLASVKRIAKVIRFGKEKGGKSLEIAKDAALSQAEVYLERHETACAQKSLHALAELGGSEKQKKRAAKIQAQLEKVKNAVTSTEMCPD